MQRILTLVQCLNYEVKDISKVVSVPKIETYKISNIHNQYMTTFFVEFSNLQYAECKQNKHAFNGYGFHKGIPELSIKYDLIESKVVSNNFDSILTVFF